MPYFPPQQPRDRLRRISCCLLVFLTILVFKLGLSGTPQLRKGPSPSAAPPKRQEAQQCEPSKPTSGEEIKTLANHETVKDSISAGRSRVLRLCLRQGQFLRVEVAQQGIDLALKLFDPTRQPVIQVNNLKESYGVESILIVARSTGGYLLELAAQGDDGGSGEYETKIGELRAAVNQDLRAVDAFKKYTQAVELRDQGDFIKASSLAEESLKFQQVEPTPNRRRASKSLSTQCSAYLHCSDAALTIGLLADLYRLRGEYEEADELFSAAYEMLNFSETDPHQPFSRQIELNLLLEGYGKNCQALGKEAGNYFERALEGRRAIWGESDPKTLSLLDQLGDMFRDASDYRKAEQYYRLALSRREKSETQRPCEVITSRLNLASLYYLSGKLAEAESVIKQVGDEDAAGRGCRRDENLVDLFLGQARRYHLQGEMGQGEEYFDKAYNFYLRAFEYQNREFPREKFPDGHPEIARTKQAIADLRLARGNDAKKDWDELLQLYKEVYESRKNTLAPDHPDLAISLQRLARTYWDEKNQRNRARPRIFQEFFQRLTESIGIRGKTHLQIAVALLSKASQIAETNILREMLSGAEEYKTSYPRRFIDITDDIIWLSVARAQDDPQVTELALTTILHNKGRVLDTMSGILERSRNSSEPCREALNKLIQNFKKQSQLVNRRILTRQEKETFETLEKEQAELDSNLNQCNDDARSVTAANVKSELPSDAVLIEYTIYNPPGPGLIFRENPRYVAYVLTPQGVLPPVDLGEARIIDQQISLLLQALRGKESPGAPPGLTSMATVKGTAHRLYQLALQPILDKHLLNGARQILISPEGQLNLIPFAALVNNEDKFLIEDPNHTFSYLTGGLDLLRLRRLGQKPLPPGSEITALIFADAKHDSELPYKALPAGRERGDFLQLRDFERIEGTKYEAAGLKMLLPKAIVKQREKATEEAFKSMPGRFDIIHMAVHGFFLRDVRSDADFRESLGARRTHLSRAESGRHPTEDPMLRSGLALAGANLRHSGKHEDGILTARELSLMDLSGTQLAVFTSCDGGNGEVRRGEGVYGLRRALALAGVESQVTSLWSVYDREAARLIIPFYRAALNGYGRSEALKEAQLCLLKDRNLGHPYYWAGYILAGQWGELKGVNSSPDRPNQLSEAGICGQIQNQLRKRPSLARGRSRYSTRKLP